MVKIEKNVPFFSSILGCKLLAGTNQWKGKKGKKRQKHLSDEMRSILKYIEAINSIMTSVFSINLQFSGKIDFNRKNGHF